MAEQYAEELEPAIYGKAGKTWADVLRRCLYCELDINTDKTII
jgi:hypothetical protein